MNATTATGTMTAVTQHRYSDSSTLRITRDVAIPQPGTGQVRIAVRAAALNPADVFVMQGSPAILRLSHGLTKPRARHRVRGQDVAGVVDAVGAEVTHFAVGDAVFGGATGTLAEFAVADATDLAPMPQQLTWEEAAALPMAGVTAMHGLRTADLKAGDRILVNGAAGGIGHLALQLAAHQGAHVTAVCSTRNVELMTSLGAHEVVDYTQRDFTTEDLRYDVVFDNVGNHSMARVATIITPGGTLLPNSGLKGPDGGALRRVVKANLRRSRGGVNVRTFLATYSTEQLNDLAALVESGALRPVVDTLFTLQDASAALARVASGHARGKVVVTLHTTSTENSERQS